MAKPNELLTAYLPKLIAGVSNAELVERPTVSLPGHPLAIKQCHDNTDAWVAAHPTHRAVRGWLYFDLRLAGTLLGAEPYIDFLSHSVIEDDKGRLLDITPVQNQAAEIYPFIRHPGPDADFEEMVAHGMVRIKLLSDRTPPLVAFFAE